MNVTAMRQHVKALAASEGIAIRWVPLRRGHGGWADERTRTITTRYIGSVIAYATAMHELGHVLSGVTSPREDEPGYSTILRLENEAAAWDWALRAMPESIARCRAITQAVANSMRNYYWFARCGDGAPPDDSLFWKLYRIDWPGIYWTD